MRTKYPCVPRPRSEDTAHRSSRYRTPPPSVGRSRGVPATHRSSRSRTPPRSVTRSRRWNAAHRSSRSRTPPRSVTRWKIGNNPLFRDGRWVYVRASDRSWSKRVDGEYEIRRVNSDDRKAWLTREGLVGDLKIYESRDHHDFSKTVFKALVETEERTDGTSTWNPRLKRFDWEKVRIEIFVHT